MCLDTCCNRFLDRHAHTNGHATAAWRGQGAHGSDMAVILPILLIIFSILF